MNYYSLIRGCTVGVGNEDEAFRWWWRQQSSQTRPPGEKFTFQSAIPLEVSKFSERSNHRSRARWNGWKRWNSRANRSRARRTRWNVRTFGNDGNQRTLRTQRTAMSAQDIGNKRSDRTEIFCNNQNWLNINLIITIDLVIFTWFFGSSCWVSNSGDIVFRFVDEANFIVQIADGIVKFLFDATPRSVFAVGPNQRKQVPGAAGRMMALSSYIGWQFVSLVGKDHQQGTNRYHLSYKIISENDVKLIIPSRNEIWKKI